MRVALAQMNSCLGDFQGNLEKTILFAQEAAEKRCDLVVFPELNLLGYHPCDLLERPSVFENQQKVVEQLLRKLPPRIACLVGAVSRNEGKGKPYFNSALLIRNGKVEKIFSKQLLPVYDVFDDSRHFSSGEMKHNNFVIDDIRVQVLICEDMWGWDSLHEHNPIMDLNPNNTDLVINLSASPVTMEKPELRLMHARSTVEQLKAPLVYVNMVGAQDELIYDGGSFALDSMGQVVAQNAYFIEDLNVIDFTTSQGGMRSPVKNKTEYLRQSLVTGIRDFLGKTGFKKAHIGSSGGIDSAVVACLIADAIGPQNLTTIALPTQFNSEESLTLAKQLAKDIQCAFFELPIQTPFESIVKSYEQCFGEKKFSLMHENMQARLRGLMLMAHSNDTGSMLINTSNKSEYAAGYSTLYGDMCGGLAPIGDLLKSQVYELANHYNSQGELIPKGIIEREPSAELNFGQKDSDKLPAYDLLDQSVNRLVNKKEKAQSETDQWLLTHLYRSEFKRWQAAPILKVSDHAFGQGRRMPIAHKAHY